MLYQRARKDRFQNDNAGKSRQFWDRYHWQKTTPEVRREQTEQLVGKQGQEAEAEAKKHRTPNRMQNTQKRSARMLHFQRFPNSRLGRERSNGRGKGIAL